MSVTTLTSHLGPPYSTSDITLHRSLPPTPISHHHISAIPTDHTTPTLNITAHFTPHHIPHRITPHFDFKSHHLTSQHIASFSTSDIAGNNYTARCICRGHIIHRQGHSSDTTTFLAHRNFPHQSFCIWIAFHITPCLELQHSTSLTTCHIAPFHIKSLHISAHHSTSRPHSTSPHHAHYHIQI